MNNYFRLLLTINILLFLWKLSDAFELTKTPIIFPEGELVLGLGRINGMQISPDHKYLAIYGIKGAFLIRRETGVIEKYFYPNEEFRKIINWEVKNVLFSPDGSKILIRYDCKMDYFGYAQTLGSIYDLSTFKELYTINTTGVIPFRPFSPDGKQFIYSEKDDIKIIHFDDGVQTNVPTQSIRGYSFFTSNYQVVCAQVRNASVFLVTWDTKLNIEIQSVLLGWYILGDISPFPIPTSIGAVNILGWGPEPNTVIGFYAYQQIRNATGGGNIEIYLYLWDALTGKIIKAWNQRSISPYNIIIDISPDNRWLAIPPKPIDLTADSTSNSPFGDVLLEAEHVTIQSDSKYIIIDNRLYDLESGKLEDELFLRDRAAYNGSFTPDGHYLAVDYDLKAIQIWDLKLGKLLTSINNDYNVIYNYGHVLEFSPDGLQLVKGFHWGAFLTDTNNWQIAHVFYTSNVDLFTTVNYDPSGKALLITGATTTTEGREFNVHLYDTQTFQPIRTIGKHSGTIMSAHFSPDGKRIVAADSNGAVKIWEVETGRLITTFTKHTSKVYYAVFFPDGKHVLTADVSRFIYIWNAETGNIESTFENVYMPVILSPDGQLLFTGSQVWELNTNQLVKDIDGMAMDMFSLSLSRNGKYLLTSDQVFDYTKINGIDGTTKIWSVYDQIYKTSGIHDYNRFE